MGFSVIGLVVRRFFFVALWHLVVPVASLPSAAKSESLNVERTFQALLEDPQFLKSWQCRALEIPSSKTSFSGSFTIDDVERCVSEDFLVAGRGTFEQGRTGWKMAQVGRPRGNSFDEAKLKFVDIQNALKEKSGTVVVNSAGSYVPILAKVCEDCLNCFGLPVNINLYITAAGQSTSAPPHTDKQDVFVIQTQGKKHWRVYEPPNPSLKFKVDPMERGKGSDVLSLRELEDPVIDTVLSPGMMLYVPAGWPHTTDTLSSKEEATEPSVHLTVGVDTHIWGLNYASAREYCLSRAGVDDCLAPLASSLTSKEYWRLQETLPLGFLGDNSVWGTTKASLALEVANRLVDRLQTTEPAEWGRLSREDILKKLDIITVVEKLINHHQRMMSIFGNMYADVAYELTDVPMNLGFLRSKPYFDQLEATMADLVAWGKPRTKSVENNLKGGSKKKAGFGSVSRGKKQKKRKK